ncbi:uncharacterized protein (DUF2235 family) [Isoptericola sp. CG 20/1183]|uniref:Uncharacterized protein (DUF2235 family) n=1 Tax=Isoptericola halotolerans TaxID=300560 RepID=A0ABX5EGC0_9MICO|nr:MULTISPECIES: DUF2235 domain-containing protein [Isoptericola]PRZ07816.1 uncharacterized protein (DUF2235 family) [Isoptericola halotolerans]PRZ07825.1 uncharacterized protein (DUF2235 family) [Isoptericola sp. CG 20/1183]
MKRLVLCCDGTWNHGVNQHVSNIEKIARVVRRGLVPADDGPGVVQQVEYVGGVGARGYKIDQVLGGAFGYGLTRNVVDGYRFLAMNHEPGDEIVVLGYSRGAYTARSVVGMVGQVGLLTRGAILDGRLPEAERLYRRRARGAEAEEALARDRRDFRRAHGQEVPVRFLGVFDTVGALGVPVLARHRYQFHDVRLGDRVEVARQALAIDERRLTFAPCLWQVPPGAADRVRQVWFPGGHGDVGGGGAQCGLSDVALLWMVEQLRAVGVAIDEDSLARQTAVRGDLVVATRPRLAFRLVNGVRRMVPGGRTVDGREVFRGGLRVLAQRDGDAWRDAVAVAAPVVRHVERDSYAQHARNLQWWLDGAGGVGNLPTVPVVGLEDDDRVLSYRS